MMKSKILFSTLFILLSFLIINIFFPLFKTEKENILKKPLQVENEVDSKTLKLYLWWDIMLSRAVWHFNKVEWYDRVLKNYNPTSNLSNDTLLFFNLESPISDPDKDKKQRTFSFWMNKANLSVLEQLKGEREMFLTLANNHILNSSFNWVDLTTEALENHSINHVWLSYSQRTSFKTSYKDWLKICYNWYTYDWNKYYNKNKKDYLFVNAVNETEMISDLNSMKNDNCDLKLMFVHWWAEYKTKPSEKMKSTAHNLVDNWLDVLIGSHSHIFWETEFYKGKFIAYSLWNYIFDQDWWKDWCLKNMDCIYDKKLKKYTVPTYIWHWINLNINYEDKKFKDITNFSIDRFRIDNFWQLNEF